MSTNNNHKKIGLTFDLREDYLLKEGEPADKYAEFDAKETIDIIMKAIEANGHRVLPLGGVNNLLSLEKRPDVDIVFNLAEGLMGRNRESQVPILLELMQIPFVGGDALTLGLTLDKILTKKIFIAEKIPTPRFFQATNIADLKKINLKFPLIVKARFEGSSKSLTEDALVNDMKSLKRGVSWLIKTYQQPALIEEFIAGREFTVPIIGNNPPKAYYPVQIKIDGKLKLGDLFYTHARISSSDLEYIYPAKISKVLTERIRKLALRAYLALECRDFGRVDFRVNDKNAIFVLEVNPLPSLSVEDVFMKIAEYEGKKFSDVIGMILKAAFRRYNFNVGSNSRGQLISSSGGLHKFWSH